MPEAKMTWVRTCEHCGNRAPMKIVATYKQDRSEVDWDDGYPVLYFRAESEFQTITCPSCERVIFRQLDWDETDPQAIGESVLFPEVAQTPSELPESIARAYEAARRVRNLEANAYGVLVGRLLEMICHDQGAEGKDLFNKLNDLSAKQVIPERLAGVAQGLRKLRNIGAHADLGELTEDQVPLLEKLARAILEYVYTAPFLARQAEELLAQLRPEPESK